MAIFDLVLLLIVLLCVAVGFRKGFVLTLCGVLSIVIALVGAKVAADQFSPTVEKAITPRIETVITEQMNESVAGSIQDATKWKVDTSGKQNGILGILQQNEAYNKAVSEIQDSIQKGVASTVKNTASSMAKKIAQPTAWGVVYVIAFFVIMLVWNLISKALNLVAKLPVLHFFNRLLGGACGLVKGILIVGCISYLVLRLGLVPKVTAQESTFLRIFSVFTSTSI